MKIEFLISTVDRNNVDFIYRMFKNLDIENINAVIINQCINIDLPEMIHVPHDNIKIISVKDKGTSNSRNLAMENMSGDICTFTDDDLIYDSKVLDIIEKIFLENDSDIITFKTNFIENDKSIKNYREESFNHTFHSLMKTGDWEIFFRKKSIENKLIKFDSNFGLGCKYPLCEYQIFLTDCFKNGLSLLYIPKVVVRHPLDIVRTGVKFDSHIEKARGAGFARIFGWKGVFAIVYFAIKKYSLYKDRKSLVKEFIDLFSGYVELLKGY